MRSPLVEWAVANRTYPGETRSGDSHVVVTAGDRAVIAVIDGIGHGDEAAAAAAAAVEVIEQHATETVEQLFTRCHERLSDMRGAAMTLVAYEGSRNELTWLGAGNVKAALVRHEESSNTSCSDLIVRSGVVGSQLPKLDTFSAAVQHRDVLILATDGIYANFVDSVRCLENLQRQADRILANYHNPNDDALVLVVRLNGMPDTDNEHR